MLQKPQILAASYSCLHPLGLLLKSGPIFANTFNLLSKPSARQPHRRPLARPATSKAKPQGDGDNSSWPRPPSGTNIPTPYEIFKQKRGSPYSKQRFYELVKIYHPDRHIHEVAHHGCLSRATRLERYRLIIAANEILSDPIKRSAYDRWGAGWNGKPDAVDSANGASRDGRGWSGFEENSPMGNATWEDWEDWRHGNKRPQRPVYFSNGSFVVLIVLFALAGGYGEVSRANHLSRSLLQQMEDKHHATSRDLVRRRSESQEWESQKHRVENFLRVREHGQREPESIQEAAAPKALPAPYKGGEG